MSDFNLSPEAIQAHLNEGARLRSEAIHSAFANLGNSIAAPFRSVANALTGDWTGSRAA